MDKNKYLTYQIFILNTLTTDLEDSIDTPQITYKQFVSSQNNVENNENFYIANLN